MSETPDTDLVRRAALADAGAVAELYDRHAPLLLGVALRIVGARADAEDVLHDAFVSLPRRAKHYVPERGSVVAWLIVLVRNVGIDHVRRRGLAARLSRDLDAGLPAGPASPDPAESATAAQERDHVRRALAALPPPQRAALEAAFFEGLTYAQIAEREGVPLNTIKSRCARAFLALREALSRAVAHRGET